MKKRKPYVNQSEAEGEFLRNTDQCEMCLRTLPLYLIRWDSEGVSICRSCWEKPETWE